MTKRKLTPREGMLIGVLALLLLGAAYYLLFYIPVTSARDSAIGQTADCRQQIDAMQLRLSEKQRMEHELDRIFAASDNPRALPDYDNREPVMRELNSVLEGANNYSLSFASVDSTQRVVRREISINFSCDNYSAAKSVLRQLDNSAYRCMLNNLNISLGKSADSPTNVSGSIVYFECQDQA